MKRLFLVYLILITPLFAGSLEDAHQSYLLGEKATETEERERYFNQALKSYSEVESEDAKLFFNIANCYYQLDRRGMAIWYYHKAQALAPRNKKIEQNLNRAYQQSAMTPSAMEKVISQLFFFHTKLLPSERQMLFYLFSLTAFMLLSLFIWLKKPLFKTLSIYALALLAVMGTSLVVSNQSKHLSAILIQPSLIRCDAGKHYKEVDSRLELAGQKVKVLEISPDEKWVKIKVPSHLEGYVPAEKIRML